MKIRARPRKGERKDRCKTWQLSWELPGDDSKRRQETETFHGGREEAEKRWRERQAQIDNEEATNPEKITLSAYLSRWLRDYVRPNLAPKEPKNIKSTFDAGVVECHWGRKRCRTI